MSSDLSAGLDLTEFYQKDRSHVVEFWRAVQDMWHAFYTTGMPVASCISGHCPAGGLIIASCSDYRVMQRGKFTTGLNEASRMVKKMVPWLREVSPMVRGRWDAGSCNQGPCLFEHAFIYLQLQS